MKFSESVGITRGPDDDWFDPILETDTKLFVDPFLIFGESSGRWKDSHDKLIGIFEHAFSLLAKAGGIKTSMHYKKALKLLVFREPRELCLGYTDKGTSGAGSGGGYGKLIASAIESAIRRGVDNLDHFEQVGILQEGIGPDRISDITSTILKAELIAYTQDVAKRHGVPTKKHRVYASSFDATRLSWNSQPVELPTNAENGGPVLLVPARFLRELPVLNADDWWAHHEAQRVKEDLDYEIVGKVDKKTIVSTARAHAADVQAWSAAHAQRGAEPYDLDRDPSGLYRWDAEGRAWVEAHPISHSQVNSHEDFVKFIDDVIRQYKLFIEEQGGWRLLWRDVASGSENEELAAQLTFRGIAQHYARANDVSLDGEVDFGRGPVDFKFSRGYVRRAHLEVKKLHNGKFWHGFEEQLPSYMKSDEVTDGWFLVIQYRDTPVARQRIKDLPDQLARVSSEKTIKLRHVVIDASPKASASNIKGSPRVPRKA